MSLDAHLAALQELRRRWTTGTWSWEARTSTVTTAVSGEQIAVARALTLCALPQCFDRTTLAKAPPELAALVAARGGLRGEQLAFADGPHFGLWWPWGGGGTVSIRIGLVRGDAEHERALRAIFDLP